MTDTGKLWIMLAALLAGSFSILLWSGHRIHRNAAPMLGPENTFRFGHQGRKYADLGRLRQWFSFIGLMLSLFLAGRPLTSLRRLNINLAPITPLTLLTSRRTIE